MRGQKSRQLPDYRTRRENAVQQRQRPVSYRIFWLSMTATLMCSGIVVWLVIVNANIAQLQWRFLLGVMFVVFVVASLATTEIIPWNSTSLREWRQPKVLGSITLLLLGAAAFVSGLSNVFGPEAAQQGTLKDVANAVGASPAEPAEQREWDKREAGSCSAIQEYVRRYPRGHYVRDATALLTTAREVKTGRLTVSKHELPLTEIPDGLERPSISDAKANAYKSGERQGSRLCNLYSGEVGGRVTKVQILADEWNCTPQACGFEGRAICSIERQETRQVCGEVQS